MSLSYTVCPRCGKTSNEKGFIDAFCIDCYPLDVQIPKEIVFEVCTRCGRIKRGNEWKKKYEKEISNSIIKKCRGEFFNAMFNSETNGITFFIKKSDKILKINKPVNVRFNKTICTDCSRLSGGYYEAIIQLRGDGQMIDKLARTIEQEISKSTFISKVEEKKEGIDFYIGSTDAALDLIKELGHRYILSKKLAGVDKEGMRQYRTTFSIRL